MSKAEEIALVKAVLDHPAGFDLDLFGGQLVIRSGEPVDDEETIEVEWQLMVGAKPDAGSKLFPRAQAQQAAVFFVEKRHERRIGLDFEQLDMAAHTRRESPR